MWSRRSVSEYRGGCPSAEPQGAHGGRSSPVFRTGPRLAGAQPLTAVSHGDPIFTNAAVAVLNHENLAI